jgi:hypothetical protein
VKSSCFGSRPDFILGKAIRRKSKNVGQSISPNLKPSTDLKARRSPEPGVMARQLLHKPTESGGGQEENFFARIGGSGWMPPTETLPDPKVRGLTVMDARKVAAQFAAYAWYEENRAGQQSRKEAGRFAEENWTAFLPVAHEGLGKLLMRIAAPGVKRQRMQKRSRCLATAE